MLQIELLIFRCQAILMKPEEALVRLFNVYLVVNAGGGRSVGAIESLGHMLMLLLYHLSF